MSISSKTKTDAMAKVEDKKIIILDKIYFEYNKTVVLERSFDVLNEVVAVLTKHKYIEKIRVEGHTDTRGNARYNKRLSQGRAKVVRQYLVDHGVEENRVDFAGYAESRPIVTPETSDADYETNRRVEFVILSQSEHSDANVEIRTDASAQPMEQSNETDK